MAVPDQGLRGVVQPVALGEDTDEPVEVVAAPRECARTRRRVEAADRPQHLRTEGHAGAGAEAACGEGEQRLVGGRVVRVVRAGREALGEAAVALQEDLGGRAQPGREDQAGGAAEAGVGGERRGEFREPARVRHDVVVREGDHLAVRGLDAPVVRDGETGHRLGHVPHALGVLVCHQVPGRVRHGRVVDDDDLEVRVVLGEERVEGVGEQSGAFAGGDDDGGERDGLRAGQSGGTRRPVLTDGQVHEYRLRIGALRYLPEERPDRPPTLPDQHEHRTVGDGRAARTGSERATIVQFELGDLHRPDAEKPLDLQPHDLLLRTSCAGHEPPLSHDRPRQSPTTPGDPRPTLTISDCPQPVPDCL